MPSNASGISLRSLIPNGAGYTKLREDAYNGTSVLVASAIVSYAAVTLSGLAFRVLPTLSISWGEKLLDHASLPIFSGKLVSDTHIWGVLFIHALPLWALQGGVRFLK